MGHNDDIWQLKLGKFRQNVTVFANVTSNSNLISSLVQFELNLFIIFQL